MAEVAKTGKKNNDFNNTVATLFNGMDAFLSTKTVVGDPVQVGDTIIIPLVDVNFGVAAGAMSNGSKGSDNAAGGMGGKMSPSSVLVITNGKAKIISAKETDNLTKVLDMIPEVIDKVTEMIQKKKDTAAEDAAKDVLDSLEDEEF